ncbi:NCS2 family permease [Aminicella lysinilytica]|uniref:AGZA family xanthine/uracil permease-like MFS transporter n=1 Tax=Aminicella lysinilytica TaxID=433323 RepID=A0A4R6PZ12_9FIRM|nr:NCS2 family permease [Aminicella lysinilytica]NLD11572.1 NCS2 family permease [Clostridiales bacterium]TDP51389.1 AGZA family xanthine/uracil permease-like MFS transporter [Aminicella lysinilytica]
MEKLFKLKEHGTDVKTEMTAGLTTFLAMVYILAVNPNILSASGMSNAAVFTATAVSAAFATLVMAFYANYPVALASGMGLNAYFSYSVCIPLAQAGVQDPWKIALAAVFCEGIIFILLSLTNFREKLVNDIPGNLKLGITAGIGLFITIIGLKEAGIVIGDASTLVALGSFKTPQVVLALVGFLIIAILSHYRVKGAILIGILSTWVMGMIAQATGWYQVDVANGVYSVFPSMSGGLFSTDVNWFSFDFGWIGNNLMDFVVIVFSFLFVDIFDTVGTLIGIANKGNLLDENGKLPRAKQALLSDAVGTVFGACMGTSTVTSYVESSAGVAEGGRTGLTALTTGILFLIALPFSPIFLAIPGFATTPALVWVGLLMISSIKQMDFDGDIADVISGFMAIIMMPFTYSIANGIMFGMLSWVILKVCTGKIKDVNGIMWICFVLFAFRIYTLI